MEGGGGRTRQKATPRHLPLYISIHIDTLIDGESPLMYALDGYDCARFINQTGTPNLFLHILEITARLYRMRLNDCNMRADTERYDILKQLSGWSGEFRCSPIEA